MQTASSSECPSCHSALLPPIFTVLDPYSWTVPLGVDTGNEVGQSARVNVDQRRSRTRSFAALVPLSAALFSLLGMSCSDERTDCDRLLEQLSPSLPRPSTFEEFEAMTEEWMAESADLRAEYESMGCKGPSD